MIGLYEAQQSHDVAAEGPTGTIESLLQVCYFLEMSHPGFHYDQTVLPQTSRVNYKVHVFQIILMSESFIHK